MRLFDELIVAVGINPEKRELFTLEERVGMIRSLLKGEPGVRVEQYTGLTVDFVRQAKATAILRGIRDVSDLRYEFQLALANRAVGGVETVFIMAGDQYALTSSSLIRQVVALGGDIRQLKTLLPDVVVDRLREKHGKARLRQAGARRAGGVSARRPSWYVPTQPQSRPPPRRDARPRASWARRLLPAIGVAVLALVVMAPLCGHDFTNWDDDKTVRGNPDFNPPSFAGVTRYWREPFMDLYVPVTYMVWAVVAGVAHEPSRGLDPHVFHTFNVLLHAANAAMAFLLLRRLVGADRTWAAFAGAVLFAVHPVQVETVGWISGMKDLLCGLLTLVALWSYVAFAQRAPNGGPNSGPDADARRGACRRGGITRWAPSRTCWPCWRSRPRW